MEKAKILTILVVVMMALNAASLGFMWFECSSHTTREYAPQKDPGAVLAQYLDFSHDQKVQFDSLRNEHHGRMVVYEDSLKYLKERLSDLLLSADTLGTQIIFSSMGIIYQQIAQVTFDHFFKVREMCTPAQRKLYDPMLHRAITEINKPHRPPQNKHQPPPHPNGNDRPKRPQQNQRPNSKD